MSKTTLYRAIWIPSALAIIGMSLAFSRQPLSIPTPAKMEALTLSDKTLTLQRPANWKAHTISLHAVETSVRFEPARNIRLSFDYNLQGSLMADISKSSDAQLSNLNSMLPDNMKVPAEKLKSPLEKRHEAHKKQFEKRYAAKEYQESKAEALQVSGISALASKFTFQEGNLFGPTPMVGRRFTSLAGDRELTISYQCPKEIEKEVVPIFEKMIKSLKLGEGGN